MRTLVPKDPYPAVDALQKESGVGAKGTAVRSGAQDDGQERAEETAATVTGTSGDHATPIERLGQPFLDRLREPGLGNRMTHLF
jgi:hypothetical protein